MTITRAGKTLRFGSVPDPIQMEPLMRAAWSTGPGTEFYYHADFWRSCLSYPGVLPALGVAIFDGDEVIATVLGMARSVTLQGEPLNVLLMTCLTVSPAWRGHGLGVEIWSYCLGQARALGYDGSFHYCAEGGASNQVTQRGAAAFGAQAQALEPIGFLRRLIPAGQAERRTSGLADLTSQFLSAAKSKKADLCRRWTPSEASWQIHDRCDALAVGGGSDGCAGALAGYSLPLLDTAGSRCAIIDDLLWNGLADDDCAGLLSRFLAAAQGRAQLVIAPVLNPTDLTPLAKAGFRKSSRRLNPYLTVWSACRQSTVRSIYIDVL